MTRYNVLLVGVGGQGLLTLGSIIGNAAIENNVHVTIAETHGLSQRGGSLIVHVRLGEGSSPLIPRGATDLIIGLEALETARYIEYARENALVVMNEFLWPPPLAKTPSLNTIVDEVGKRARLYVINANKEAEKATGLVVTANTLILGYAIGVDKDFAKLLGGVDVVKKALVRVFRGKALELNKKALRRGYELAVS